MEESYFIGTRYRKVYLILNRFVESQSNPAKDPLVLWYVILYFFSDENSGLTEVLDAVV